jgi:hypothetical protein
MSEIRDERYQHADDTIDYLMEYATKRGLWNAKNGVDEITCCSVTSVEPPIRATSGVKKGFLPHWCYSTSEALFYLATNSQRAGTVSFPAGNTLTY